MLEFQIVQGQGLLTVNRIATEEFIYLGILGTAADLLR